MHYFAIAACRPTLGEDVAVKRGVVLRPQHGRAAAAGRRRTDVEGRARLHDHGRRVRAVTSPQMIVPISCDASVMRPKVAASASVALRRRTALTA